MNSNNHEFDRNHIRPVFPKRAVITAGMPYGNKDLHFGHIGGYFCQADVFARFLRDRIGRDNVIFISGTDCYGSPIVEYFRQIKENNDFDGDIQDFVKFNHERQKKALIAYNIDLNLYAASSFSRSAEIHNEISADIFNTLFNNNHLIKMSTHQFYDPEAKAFLNGRQVVGQCPIFGCSSEKGYADECALGHQYTAKDLQNPKSTLSGKTPEMREVTNWYIKLPEFRDKLADWVNRISREPGCRQFVIKSMNEFFEPPVIFVKKDQVDSIAEFKNIYPDFPDYSFKESKSKSIGLVFHNLEQRELACSILTEQGMRYRTGKTLVPFRLTGNIDWGVPVPELDNTKGLTFWVWPESLWAPISFTNTYLENKGINRKKWTDWWCSKDAKVYQFIGEDNVYFYGIAEMAIFMGLQGKETSNDPEEGQLQLPELIVNNHILFLDKKASSSGKVKPPMAIDLLDYYTSDQLRTHFCSLGLALRSISFKPKPLDPKASEKAGDPVMKEGNLLCNVFNRAIRSCFYTMQSYYNSKLPVGGINSEILDEAEEVILKFENAMYRHEFHSVMSIIDNYIRKINKYWDKNMRQSNENQDIDLRTQTLINTFHMVRVAGVLMHPIAPEGTEILREYLNIGEEFWDWNRIFEPIYTFMEDPETHEFKFLEPRVDFFAKHPSQIKQYDK